MDKFVSKKENDQEKKITEETVGLVKLDQFQKISKCVEKNDRADIQAACEKKRKILMDRSCKLSFYHDEDEEEVDNEDKQMAENFKRIKRDPAVELDISIDSEDKCPILERKDFETQDESVKSTPTNSNYGMLII